MIVTMVSVDAYDCFTIYGHHFDGHHYVYNVYGEISKRGIKICS